MIHIYTDGGCTGNPGIGGWAAVILEEGSEAVEISGGESGTTNNQMELTAAIRALEKIAPCSKAVVVHTDSQYLQKGITEWLPNWVSKGWKTAGNKPVKNQHLWHQIQELNSSMNIQWTWLKGHAGQRWNERCDQLVAIEREKFI